MNIVGVAEADRTRTRIEAMKIMIAAFRNAWCPVLRKRNKAGGWLVALPICLLSCASCASAPTAQETAQRAEFERTIPVCENESDCKAKWEAAQVWVAQNAGMKIQVATDVLIETFNPPEWSSNLGVRVLKEPLGGGRYRIVVSTHCRFVCNPRPWDAAIDFNRKVGASSG